MGVHRPGDLRPLASVAGSGGGAAVRRGYALQLRLRIISGFEAIPFELLLALPYLVVIGALIASGRNVAYPGAYLKPYRRE